MNFAKLKNRNELFSMSRENAQQRSPSDLCCAQQFAGDCTLSYDAPMSINKIYRADVGDFLRRHVDDCAADLAIVDPPYNLLASWEAAQKFYRLRKQRNLLPIVFEKYRRRRRLNRIIWRWRQFVI